MFALMGLKEKMVERERERVADLARWVATKKPAHLLELKVGDAFDALFDETEGSDRNVRSCWWNEAPAFPADLVPLLVWHPMIHSSLGAGTLHGLIEEALFGFDVEEAFYWKCEATRWVFLTLRCPGGDDYVPVDWRFRLSRGDDGELMRVLECAS